MTETNSRKILSKKLITHDGAFHADDIFASAALSIMLERENISFEIIRSRDPKVWKTGDFVYDIGGIYDESKNLFDHHQVGGAGKSPRNIEYSSMGLVWKKFGEKIAGSKKAAEIIEKRLCAPIDAWDNGFDLVENKYDVAPYYLQNVFFAMSPTWKEEDVNIDDMFLKCVELAKNILLREIVQAQDTLEAEEAVISVYNKTEDKRIIVLEKNYPFEYMLWTFPEPLFAVYPRKTSGTWGVKAIRQDPKSFNNRKNMPKLWAGLSDEDFVNVSGVADALFCHRGLWLAGAKSKVGAIKLAQIAVES
ncbi:MYG1 family protein [Candidatus Nomurabacteria bacterium]|nr:MYG1 family protein [Candidatus Nomurabacteria bacterium]